MNILKKTATSLLLLSISAGAVAQDTCPVTGSKDERIAYLSKHLNALRDRSEASKKEQEQRLGLIRAELKMEGKWSARIGKQWSDSVQSTPEFKAHQSSIERHLERYDESLDGAFANADKNPQASCSHIDTTIASMQAVQAETRKQFAMMTAAMSALHDTASGDAR